MNSSWTHWSCLHVCMQYSTFIHSYILRCLMEHILTSTFYSDLWGLDSLFEATKTTNRFLSVYHGSLKWNRYFLIKLSVRLLLVMSDYFWCHSLCLCVSLRWVVKVLVKAWASSLLSCTHLYQKHKSWQLCTADHREKYWASQRIEWPYCTTPHQCQKILDTHIHDIETYSHNICHRKLIADVDRALIVLLRD